MSATVKLQTNIPIEGTLTQVSYWPGKEYTNKDTGEKEQGSDQIGLAGVWGPHGAGRIYVNAGLALDCINLGLIRQEPGVDKYNNPRYTVLAPARPVRIIKEEIGGNRKRTTITWANGAAPATQVNPSAPPTAAQAAHGATQSAAAVVKSGNAAEAAKALEQLQQAHRRRFQQIRDNLILCFDTALQVVADVPGHDAWSPDTHGVILGKTASNLFIQSMRENLVLVRKAPPKPAAPTAPPTPAAAPAPAPAAAARPAGATSLAKTDDELEREAMAWEETEDDGLPF